MHSNLKTSDISSEHALRAVDTVDFSAESMRIPHQNPHVFRNDKNGMKSARMPCRSDMSLIF